MADKFLSEAEWKKFAKGRDLKDAALLKALAAVEKSKGPTEQLEALKELETQADALRKFVKGDREFGAYLDGIDKALDKEEKLAKAAAAKEAESSESEGEEDGQDQLTSKLVPLLRQVKKGEQMQAMLAYGGGKDVAVLLSRRAISPSKRKLLTDYLNAGTQKFALGHCIFEENAYTFVLQTQAAGLAKKVRAALLKQVELRLKVRVRGEDPNDIDDDGEEAELEVESDEGVPQGQTTTAASNAPDPLKTQYEQRMAALVPQVLATLKAGAGDVGKIRAVAEFAREKGESAIYVAALKALDSLEKLLQAATPEPVVSRSTTSSTATSAQAQGDEAGAFKVRLAAMLLQAKPVMASGGEPGQKIKLKLAEAGALAGKKEFAQAQQMLDEVLLLLTPAGTPTVAWADAREQWQGAMEAVDAQLNALRAAILEWLDGDDPEVAQYGPAMRQIAETGLSALTADRRVKLMASLMQLGSGELAMLKARGGHALNLVRDFADFLADSERVASCDENDLGVAVSIRATLIPPLRLMAGALETALAS